MPTPYFQPLNIREAELLADDYRDAAAATAAGIPLPSFVVIDGACSGCGTARAFGTPDYAPCSECGELP